MLPLKIIKSPSDPFPIIDPQEGIGRSFRRRMETSFQTGLGAEPCSRSFCLRGHGAIPAPLVPSQQILYPCQSFGGIFTEIPSGFALLQIKPMPGALPCPEPKEPADALLGVRGFVNHNETGKSAHSRVTTGITMGLRFVVLKRWLLTADFTAPRSSPSSRARLRETDSAASWATPWSSFMRSPDSLT